MVNDLSANTYKSKEQDLSDHCPHPHGTGGGEAHVKLVPTCPWQSCERRGALREEEDEGLIAPSPIRFAVCWCCLRPHLQQQRAG